MPNSVVKYNTFYPSKIKDNKIFIVIDTVFDYSRVEVIADYLREKESFKFFIFSKSYSESIRDKDEIETDNVIAGLFSIKEEYDVNIASNLSYVSEMDKVLKVIDVALIDDFLAINKSFIKNMILKQKPSMIETDLLEKSDLYTIGQIAELNKWPISFIFNDISVDYVDVYESFFSFLRLKFYNPNVLKAAIDIGINGFFIKIDSVDELKVFLNTLESVLKD